MTSIQKVWYAAWAVIGLAWSAAAFGADIYCSSTATGSNNGTSWPNAYTSFSTALSAAANGDVIYTNSTDATPFTGSFVLASKSNVRIVGNQGPNAKTVCTAGLKATDWSDSGGVWSKGGFSAEPTAVSYDLKFDDLAGTVTGCTITPYRAAHIGRLGYSPDKCRGLYGFLVKTAGTQSAPANGEYGYASGTLYVNPPGTPVEADVDAKTVYHNTAATHGLNLTSCTDCRVEGLTFWWHVARDGNNGYSLRGDDCVRVEFYRCESYASGWHPFGFAGTGTGNYDCLITECLANGMTGDETTTKNFGSNVFYQTNTPPDRWGNNYGRRNLSILIPRLNTSGAPLMTGFNSNPMVSHSSSGSLYTGVYWDDCTAIDFTDDLVTKHTLTNTATGTFCNHANGPTPSTLSDPTTYSCHVKRCAFLGRMSFSLGATEYDSCLFDRSGCAAVSMNNGISGSWTTIANNCTTLTGNFTGTSTGYWNNLDSGDYVRYTGSRTRALIECTTAKSAFLTQAADTGTSDNFFLAGDIDSNGATTHAVVRAANPTIYNNNIRDTASLGNVRFGAGLEGTLYHSNTGAVPTPQNFAWWIANITGASTDQAPTTFVWGTTAAEKVEYLREQWLKENPPPRPYIPQNVVISQ